MAGHLILRTGWEWSGLKYERSVRRARPTGGLSQLAWGLLFRSEMHILLKGNSSSRLTVSGSKNCSPAVALVNPALDFDDLDIVDVNARIERKMNT